MQALKSIFFPSINDAASRRMIMTLAAIMCVIPILNLLFAEDSFFHVSNYTINLLGKYFCYAILAVALDLVWGYCGILSLGHGAFFALGGYAMGMYLVRQYGVTIEATGEVIPEFMIAMGISELPWFWYGFDNFWFALLMVVLAPGLLAYLFGYFAFKSRVSGVYLSIITQAMTFALMQGFRLGELGFGGTNGLTAFKEILGFDITSDMTRLVLFMLTVFVLLLALMLSKFITKSKAGRVLVAIRDAEPKTRFIGYRVEHYKLFVFVISAALAGIAGSLFVSQVGIINPDEFSPLNSIEIVIWVALGGRATIYGAIIGAVLVNYAKTVFTGLFPEFWVFLLGGLFVVSTLFFPKGIAGMFSNTKFQSLMGGIKQKMFSKKGDA
ncbi:urea ABC transporter permease subunit UrtC [Marinicellulosiphila megalodicopiae]|uniref:urea ABC transporter permease subunit UrtC n=1 Tax=Marinicellulosiphila megalodicopiae TaxID=2724896 RepID=UPI003BB0CB3F